MRLTGQARGTAPANGCPINAHRFCHTFATRLVMWGMDSRLAMKLTHHQPVKSFERYMQRGDTLVAAQMFSRIVTGREGD